MFSGDLVQHCFECCLALLADVCCHHSHLIIGVTVAAAEVLPFLSAHLFLLFSQVQNTSTQFVSMLFF